nr:NADH dehydrogenase subunit 11 [Guinardia striata]
MKYFFINNSKINYVPNNRSIIEYCENLGIDIPHYCYHPKLSIAGNCRMCLVEVKGSPKPVISCAMSLLNKMEIYTDSPLVKKSREGVLEFLLLNHPLDCPVCDQGGECDLQDQSFVFGINKKRFYNYKRIVTNKNIGPIVKTVMTRCIHCTRCVRFSEEVAGTSQLGVYGRGVTSEIGTYVTKLFNSELSGNVIDICPVGALTSKQYPFIGRIWELKNINHVDYSDSSLSNIQIYIKSNSIVKILPGYNPDQKTNNWITDKTRFSFDGMFSPERISNVFISGGNDKKNFNKVWSDIFNDIVYILYFQNHLSKHFINDFNLFIIFNKNIDIETLTLLLLLSKNFPFVKLRSNENTVKNIDLDSSFLMKTGSSINDLSKSNVCLLINVNTRYENSELNLKLKKRISKGNFTVFSLNSLTDLTYPVTSLGSNFKILKKIVEGNHRFSHELAYASNPTIIIGSELYNRIDSIELLSLIQSLNNYIPIVNKNWNGLNILSTYSNEIGVNSLNMFRSFSIKDMSSYSSILFIDNDFITPNIKKLIELRLLDFIDFNKKNQLMIEIHNIFKSNFIPLIKSIFNSSAYINLPNKTFFEDNVIIQNNLGNYTKTIKVLNSNTQSRTNWQIIRKLKSILSQEFLFDSTLSFNFSKVKLYQNFIGFQYLPVNSLINSSFFFKSNFSLNNYIHIKKSKSKIFETKSKFWLDDFYIGGKDLYSRFSIVMIECSKSFRLESTNFNYIN